MSDLAQQRLAYCTWALAAMFPGETEHCFQAIEEVGSPRRASRNMFGTFAAHQAELDALSAQRWGVYVAVNRTDGMGREKHNIIGIRAVWLDLDKQGVDLAAIRAALEPHVIVESSPGKFHVYWFVADCTLDEFDALLDAITTRWGGDHGAKGRNRVLRLPGYPHQKRTPFTSAIIGTPLNRAPYTTAEILATLLAGTAIQPQQSAAIPDEWTAQAEDEFTNAPASDVELEARLRDETAPPRAHEIFGEGRSTAWLMQATDDQVGAGRSEARMSLLTRAMHKAGGNCEQVFRIALRVPLCVKDDREKLLRAEILKARATFLEWWRPEHARREAQRAEARAIGEAIDDPVLTPALTMEEALRRLVFVAATREVADRVTGRIRSWESFVAEFASSRHRYRDADGKEHNVSLAPAWRAQANRITVDVAAWVPDAPEFCAPPEALGANTRAINLWKGLRPLAAPTNWQEWVRPFLDHVAYLVPDETQRVRFLQWLAHIAQYPGELPHTCYVMIASETGIGRNWLGGLLARVFAGYTAAGVSLVPILDGKFNGRLSQRLLATVDETREGMSANRHAQGEALKRLVTEESRLIDTKYGKQVVEKNCCRWLMFSNHLDAVPFESNDRRVIVIENPTQRRDPTYYTWLYGLLARAELIGSVRQHLQALDISTFNPGAHAPMSAAKQRAISVMASGIDRAVQAFKSTWPGPIAGRSDVRAFVTEDIGEPPREAALRHALDRAGIAQSGQRIRIGAFRDRPLGLSMNLEELDALDPRTIAAEIERSRAKQAEFVPQSQTVPGFSILVKH